jgi:hypothetical protein
MLLVMLRRSGTTSELRLDRPGSCTVPSSGADFFGTLFQGASLGIVAGHAKQGGVSP